MDDAELVHRVIREFRPAAGETEVGEIVTTAIEPYRDADVARRNLALFALERFVLDDQGGHRFDVRLGKARAANSPTCWVCRRPVAQGDYSLELRSRWEQTLVWLTWHDYCLDGPDAEQEFDLLSGAPTSHIGLA